MTMPQTRHYEMKDSGVEWIGKMPSNWQVKYLFQLASQVKNKNNDLREKNLLSLSYGKIKRKDIETTDGLLPASFDGYNIIEEGDIVMRLTDLQNDHTSLRVGRASERGIITSAYTTVRPSKETSPFLYLALHSFDVKKGFYGMGAGVRQGLNYGEVKKVLVPVPPLSEQAAIAAYLDEKCATIDAIIAEAKASIEEYKSWKASVIFETVTKGLNPYAEMKDSGVEWIGEIPRAWSAKRIKTLALSSRSLFTDGDWINSPDISEAGIRYFTTGNIGQGYFKEQGNGYITTETFNRLNCTMVHAGDLIISRLNEPIGRACIIPGHYKDCIVAVDNVILRPDDGYNKKYLMYCMSSDRYAEYTALLARGTTMHRISRTQLGNIFLPIPPSSEQAFIVSYLDEKCAAIDDVIAEKEELIGELENYKKSLIFEVVTGKRRVC